jgi:hypothetical protein
MQKPENFPDYEHPFYQEIAPTLDFFADLWLGKSAWFCNGQIVDAHKCNRYLPFEKHELDYQYQSRLERSRYENRFRETIEKDFAGLLSQFELIEPTNKLLSVFNNIDCQGNDLRVFLKAADCLALRDGLCFVYVDYQPLDTEINSEDIRQAKNRRPFLVLYPRDRVINWKVHYSDGTEQIDLLVIKEYVYVPVGEYGQELEERYRILTPGNYEVVKVIKENGQKMVIPVLDANQLPLSGQTSLQQIPLVPYSLTSTDSFVTSTFPLADIADMSLELYRLHSDKLENLHKCNIPVPTFHEKEGYSFKGEEHGQKEAVIGYNTAYWNVELKWAEPEGKAIAATQAECKSVHEAIDAKTIAFLSGSQIARTATEALLNSTQARSNFAGLASQKESAVERILAYFNVYESSLEGRAKQTTIKVDEKLIDLVTNLTPKDLLDSCLTGSLSKEFTLRRLSESKAFGRQLSEEEIKNEINR